MVKQTLSILSAAITVFSATAGPPLEVGRRGDAVFLRMTPEAVGQDVFLTARVVSTNGHGDIVDGQTFFEGKVVRFSFGDSVLSAIPDSVSMPRRYDGAPQLLFVARMDGDVVEADITTALYGEIEGLKPLPGGFGRKGAKHLSSRVVYALGGGNNVDVGVENLYARRSGDTLAVTIGYNFLLLDDPMPVRMYDPRVGFDMVKRPGQPVTQDRPVTRWRIEPREQDVDCYLAGELVEPAKPIVFHIDSRLPEVVRKYGALGLMDWNEAFEAIGFKNVIQVDTVAADPDTLFRRMYTNALIFAPIGKANAMGATVCEPRTGEILQGNIFCYTDLIGLLLRWRFIQTAATDHVARFRPDSPEITEEYLGPMIRYVVAHEMGHVLGMGHNMRASYAFPVDSLRSAAFTRRNGTAASIMDYARFNYVAQPGDEGVNLMPPLMGEYDVHAVTWGYLPFLGRMSEENLMLEEILARAENNPYLLYAERRGRLDPIPSDPSLQTNVLGDDVVLSSRYGIENLKFIAVNLPAWADEYGYSDELFEERYMDVLKQLMTYLTNSASYVGGEYTVARGRDIPDLKVPVDSDKALEALSFVVGELVSCSQWLVTGAASQRINNLEDRVAAECGKLFRTMLGMLPRRIEFTGTMTHEEFVQTVTASILSSAGSAEAADAYLGMMDDSLAPKI